jgi:hypothetical protein
MFEYVDGYCERLMPGFWDEPLNAVTNIAFIIAALLVTRKASAEGRLGSPFLYVPLFFLYATGVGSFLFHTLANGWSGLADVLALGFCLLTTIYCGARLWLGQDWLTALFWPGGMLVAAFAFGALAPVPGSFYFGPLAAGAAFAVALYRARRPEALWIAGAVLVFLPSFFFRTIDGPLCESFSYGTHFMWHILNGIVLGLAIWPLARSARTDGGGTQHGSGRAVG